MPSWKNVCPFCKKIITQINPTVFWCDEHKEVTVQEIWKFLHEEEEKLPKKSRSKKQKNAVESEEFEEVWYKIRD